MESRKEALDRFVNKELSDVGGILPLAHDASFRRYYRILTEKGTFLVMDAPPTLENTKPYIAISKALRQLSLQAPEVLAADTEQGFLLITDFGDLTYLSALSKDNADILYTRALHALSRLQACEKVEGHPLPLFSYEFMLKEWEWHKEWFMQKWLGLSGDHQDLDQCYTSIAKAISLQPTVFMHRDYHSGNLMVLDDDVGILDFQDAFIGPITYDLASLLRDCYIAWPNQQVEKWVKDYFALLALKNVQIETFVQWFDWMSIQRHLKALMTFARKKVRDNQPQYLQHIPRTLHYLTETARKYPELAPLQDYLRRVMIDASILVQG